MKKFRRFKGNTNSIKVSLMFTDKRGKTKKYFAGTSRRFISRIQREDFALCYVHVVYGKDRDNFGKIRMFHNDGEYDNKQEAATILRAFIE